jgi:NTE family protein
MNESYCLVLAGGGTRGAYQLGAWNALKETGISVRAIAGTSIGAINAAFIIQGDIEKMEQLYFNIDIDDVMDANIDMKKNKSLFSISNVVKVARDYIRHKGFSNEPLRRLLEKNLDLEKIYASDMDFGLVTYSIKDHKPLEILKKDIKKEEFIQYLLASACFPIYRAQKIGENVFLDGGLYDNLPINMMIKANYKRFIVIDSSAIGMRRGLISKDVYIKFIRPSESLGGIFEFDKERIRKNILLGYLDTLKAFSKLQGHRYYFKTDDFNEVLTEFNLQTIAGLEFAAKVYGMDQYKIYNSEDFFERTFKQAS